MFQIMGIWQSHWKSLCCGIYSFIVLNNLSTIRLKSQDKRAVPTHGIQDVSHE